MNKKICFVGGCSSFGGVIKGSELGPRRVFELLKEKIPNNMKFYENCCVEAKGNNDRECFLKNKNEVCEINEKIYSAFKRIINDNNFPVLIGGDHSLSAGSIMAVSEKYENLGVIWVDAHADFNDEKITNSGNMHGMPLSSICGLGPECMVDYVKIKKNISPKNIVIIGGRDFEPEEVKKLNREGVKYYLYEDIEKRGLNVIVKESIEYLSNVEHLHLSFDVDSISPLYAPGTGTPVDKGLNPQEVYELIESLMKTKKIVSMDLVEINPILDINDKTSKLAVEILLFIVNSLI